MKSPQQPTHEPQTRQERLRRRGVPAIALGTVALAVFSGYLIGQSATNEIKHNQSVDQATANNTEHDNFMTALDEAALKMANPDEVIPDSAIIDPGNHLYAEASKFADEHNLSHNVDGVDTILQTAIAISKKNLIQPGSEFVVSNVDVDGDGTNEVIVQVSPVDLPTLSK